MARKFPSDYIPIRIGAIVANSVQMCEGCKPNHEGQPPHRQPNLRFTLLMYVAVIESPLPGMAKDSPLIGGPFTTHLAVGALQAAPSKAASQLLRLSGWN